MVERFDQTLLGMLGTLTSNHKSNWKEYVPSLVHSYNGAKHESTGFSPFYLMFGRHPRLPIDIVLGIAPRDGVHDDMPEYVQKMKKRLSVAYDSHAKNAAQRSKQRDDMKVRKSLLEPGDRVLIALMFLPLTILRLPNLTTPYICQSNKSSPPNSPVQNNSILYHNPMYAHAHCVLAVV